MTKTAILLHNLGGPASEEETYPFLERLFSDPEILRFPLSSLLQKPLARWVARRRAPEAWRNYQAIGGGSPILRWTEQQAAGLALGLSEHVPAGELRVLPAMRYSPPLVRDALEAARAFGATRVLSFSLYPHFSRASTGSSEAETRRCLREMSWEPEVRWLSHWWHDPGYLDCMAWRARRAIDKVPAEARASAHVVYSAHGIPQSFVDAGDPYVDHIEGTVAGIRQRLASELPQSLAYQSRVGPMRWTRPYLIPHVESLAHDGCRSLVVVPVSFVSDHVETLFELDIDLARRARDAGIAHYTRAEPLNADPDFLGVLTHLAVGALG